MRKGPAVALAVVAFLIATSVLVYLGRGAMPAGHDAAAATSTAAGPVPDEDGAPGSSTDTMEAASVPAAAVRRAASNVPVTRLKEGEKPPQFVLFSLDGAGSHDIWQQFLATATASSARFTAFLTGTYLIDDAHAGVYTGPGHEPGISSAGFGGSKDDIATEVADLNAAWAAGHEIGTHYNGHFCAGNAPSGDDWTAADWDSELGQFFTFVDTFRAINGYDDVPPLAFTSKDVRGGRIPCLEGDLAAVTPVWKKHKMTYDSSKNRFAGIAWPEAIDGIWEFQVPYAYSPAFGRNVIGMNYNMWATFNGAKDDPSSTARLRTLVRQTYDYQFDAVFNGNRAPLVIETHASDWNGDSFVPPALDFMADVCMRADVICATYSDVIAWMQAQDPKVLQELQSRAPVAAGP